MFSPGFFSRLKEKGTLAKDVWGVIGSALSVRDLMLVGHTASKGKIFTSEPIFKNFRKWRKRKLRETLTRKNYAPWRWMSQAR